MTSPIGFLARETCRQCGASALTENPDFTVSVVKCNCCPEDHDHNAAAAACPGANLNHADVPCNEDDPVHGCHVTPAGEDCPGGHCGLRIDGCTVCRPVHIEILSLGAPVNNAMGA